MNQNATNPEQLDPARDSEDLTAGGSGASLPQGKARAQQPGLFPGRNSRPIARPVIVGTAGRIEYAARCPQCRDWHRHVSLGEKTAPCGAVYLLEPRRGRQAA